MHGLPSRTCHEEVVVVLAGWDQRHLVGYIRQKAVHPLEDVTGREDLEGHDRILLPWGHRIAHSRAPMWLLDPRAMGISCMPPLSDG